MLIIVLNFIFTKFISFYFSSLLLFKSTVVRFQDIVVHLIPLQACTCAQDFPNLQYLHEVDVQPQVIYLFINLFSGHY